MSDDRLSALRARLAALDDSPLGAHPELLDEVHRGLVAELDRLAVDRTATA